MSHYNSADFGRDFGADLDPSLTYSSSLNPALFTSAVPAQAPQTIIQKAEAFFAAYKIYILAAAVAGAAFYYYKKKK